MKNRFIIVYTIFASLVFVFSLGFFGYNLYSEYSVNYNKSEDKFNQLVTDVKYLSNEYSENAAPYAEAVKKAIGNPEPYAFLELKRDNQTILLYPAGKTKDETLSNMTRSFENKISLQNQTINLYCNYYLIHPNSIFYYARVSFLMILIITLITVIMIVYLSLNETRTVINEESFDDEEIENEELSLEEKSDENVEVSETNTEETAETNTVETEPDSPIEEKTETVETAPQEEASEGEAEHEEISTDENPVTQSEVEEKDVTEESPSQEVPEESETKTYEEPVELPSNEVKPSVDEDIPSGLYNPETGIGWESYLLPRLNNEIERATASEIDLALFVIKLSDLHLDSDEYKNVCRYLTLQFQFKDLLFEYKDDSIVAIKISMDVDAAITFAEKLYQDIHNIINNKACFIGISSRSIRMVTGERLMLEADQAIEHAIQDPDSPIIAFRVDSDKYRQMMEQK